MEVIELLDDNEDEKSTESTILNDLSKRQRKKNELTKTPYIFYDFLQPIKNIVEKNKKEGLEISLLYCVLVFFYDSHKDILTRKEILSLCKKELDDTKNKITSLRKTEVVITKKNYLAKIDSLLYKNKCFIFTRDKSGLIKLNKNYITKNINLIIKKDLPKKIIGQKKFLGIKRKNINNKIIPKIKEDDKCIKENNPDDDFELEIIDEDLNRIEQQENENNFRKLSN